MVSLATRLDKLEYLLKYAQEWNFQVLDDVSRRTGRIVKITRIFEATGFSPRKQLSIASIRKLGAMSAQWESLYPQTLGVQLFCHVPKVLRGLLDYVILPLAPAKVLEKTRVIAPRENAADRAALIAWLGEGGAEWLPRFLGGQSDIEAKDEHTVVHPNLSLKDYLRDNGREFARQ